MNKGSNPDSVFVLDFGVAVGVLVLVQETNRYCQQYLDTSDSEPSAVPGVTQSEMLLFSGYYYSNRTLCTGQLKRYRNVTE
jgi:hypothetical protein